MIPTAEAELAVLGVVQAASERIRTLFPTSMLTYRPDLPTRQLPVCWPSISLGDWQMIDEGLNIDHQSSASQQDRISMSRQFCFH